MPYQSKLSLLETLEAVELIKRTFGDELCSNLNLTWVPPSLFVETNSGLNDKFNYDTKPPVKFDLPSGVSASVFQSMAKWKRFALKKYDFGPYSGINIDSISIRKDEELGPDHSYHVDQWEFEVVIKEEDRNAEFLKSVVRDIYECMKKTEEAILRKHPNLSRKLPGEIQFVSSQEMEDAYPELTPRQRESKYTEKHGAVFVSGVGHRLKSGKKHDGRSPDTDDWKLDGDILVHYADAAFELCSMGIRVDKETMVGQLAAKRMLHRLKQPFHEALANGELPHTVGGGIGQSRFCMYLLDKAHIGEVQVSVWNECIINECKEKNIQLL